MAGTKRAYTLEWVSNDGDSFFSATGAQGRRTMGRGTKTIQFKVGDTVGLQDQQDGVYDLHEVHKSDPDFLVVGADEATTGPGCSTDGPGAEGRKVKPWPPATAMTAAELIKTGGEYDVITAGSAGTGWEGRGPDGRTVRRDGYGQLTLGAS